MLHSRTNRPTPQLRHQGSTYRQAGFDTAKEAAEWYDNKARKVLGDEAALRVNFPTAAELMLTGEEQPAREERLPPRAGPRVSNPMPPLPHRRLAFLPRS